jgi:hypothetical protein
VAKTYTLIKDKVGKKVAPLDVFLKLACPKMGIIAVGDYLKMLNWTVAREEGVLKLTQIGRPNLGTLDRAVVDCSMNHIDLLQYVLDSGYLDGVDNNFTNEVDHSSVHMLVSSAINFPEQAEVAFTRAIQKDPKAIAAFIFGTGLDSRFFDISAGQSDVLVHTDGKQLANNILPIPVALPTNVSDPVYPGQLVEQMATIGYPWTGNMSQLYKPSEMAIDFEAMMEENEWAVTDIGNPLEMDNYLKAVGGFNDDDLYAGCKFVLVLQMKIANHSQIMANLPTCSISSATHSNQQYRSSSNPS